MKLIFKILILVILAAFVWNLVSGNNQGQPLISFSSIAGHISINVRPKEKEELKQFVKQVKGLVYHEATVHNPPGNMLPDQVDNNVIHAVKETVN